MSRQDLHLHDLVACGVRDVSVLELGENGAIRHLRTHDERYNMNLTTVH